MVLLGYKHAIKTNNMMSVLAARSFHKVKILRKQAKHLRLAFFNVLKRNQSIL